MSLCFVVMPLDEATDEQRYVFIHVDIQEECYISIA